MKKLILIGGIGCTGKTILAKQIGKTLKIPDYNADNIYQIAGWKLNLPKEKILKLPMHWDNPEGLGLKDWGIYKTSEELIRLSYLEYFSYHYPEQMIIEGCFPCLYPRENKIVREIFKDYSIQTILLAPEYEQWLKNRSKRMAQPNEYVPGYMDKCDYDIWNKRLREFSPDAIIIKDVDKQLRATSSGRTDYQRPNDCETKWTAFGLRDVDLSGKTFLDISCNAGYFVKKAYDQGAIVSGLDISWELLNMTFDKVPTASLYLNRIEDFEFPYGKGINGKYYRDIILCTSSFHYYMDREAILEKISKSCKMFILELPVLPDDKEEIKHTSIGPTDYGDTESRVTKPLIERWLRKYFPSVVHKGNVVYSDHVRPVYICENIDMKMDDIASAS